MMRIADHSTKRSRGDASRLISRVSLGIAVIKALTSVASAQLAMPGPKAMSDEKLFQRQCATCHTLSSMEVQRQGPTLAGVYGRRAGSVKGFSYSTGFAKAGWSWDSDHLDVWLTNPQAMIAGAVMPYRQAKPEIRAAIIRYLKDKH